ncbi:MAG: hypothetical protein FWD57_14155 [Polyangiaceae bacterium]|nr:hypothetical protein [Polyangiaceae bacterium]
MTAWDCTQHGLAARWQHSFLPMRGTQGSPQGCIACCSFERSTDLVGMRLAAAGETGTVDVL